MDARDSGELAERSGTSRDTIRCYEAAGVLPEPRRTDAGHRIRLPAVPAISAVGS